MLLAAIVLLQSEPTQSQIEALVRAKDVSGLTQLVDIPRGSMNPFHVLQTGGAYAVGQYGWTVSPLESADGKHSYFVIGTKLTSEDVGEIVLERGVRLRYVPETDSLGVKIRRHKFDLKLSPADQHAEIQDELNLNCAPGDAFLFRMSPQYKVESI